MSSRKWLVLSRGLWLAVVALLVTWAVAEWRAGVRADEMGTGGNIFDLAAMVWFYAAVGVGVAATACALQARRQRSWLPAGAWVVAALTFAMFIAWARPEGPRIVQACWGVRPVDGVVPKRCHVATFGYVQNTPPASSVLLRLGVTQRGQAPLDKARFVIEFAVTEGKLPEGASDAVVELRDARDHLLHSHPVSWCKPLPL